MGDIVLNAEKLEKKFDDLSVIDGWNLKVEKGERVVLFGPSGCGKTTFLKIVAGLEEKSSGSFDIDYERIGFVFQEPRLIPWRNVKRNLSVVLEDDEKIVQILKKTRLEGFEFYLPSQLSGGMKQRVNLARALLVDPDLLVLDEPFGSLDLPIKLGIMQDINSLWEAEKFTVLMVTHDVKEALYLGNRVLLLSKRPSRVLKEFRVNLSRKERNLSSPVFATLEAQLIREILEL